MSSADYTFHKFDGPSWRHHAEALEAENERLEAERDRYREALEQAEAKREIAEANLAITQENLSNADAVLGRLIEDCDKAEAEGVHVLYTNHVRSLAAVGGDPE